MFLIFSKLNETKLLIDRYRMHNLYAISAKLLNLCEQIAGNLVNESGVHDMHYPKDVKVDYSNCTVIGDRGYISAQEQLDLFETANIRLEALYRCNPKEWKPTFPAFAKARK